MDTGWTDQDEALALQFRAAWDRADVQETMRLHAALVGRGWYVDVVRQEDGLVKTIHTALGPAPRGP